MTAAFSHTTNCVFLSKNKNCE